MTENTKNWKWLYAAVILLNAIYVLLFWKLQNAI